MSARSLSHTAGVMKGNVVAPVNAFAANEDNELVLMRARLRKAIDASGWKHEAIVAHMKTHGCPGMDTPYFSKLLSGEKALTLLHVCALPDDIEARFHTYNAESQGAIVVQPVNLDDARRQLATGLISLLAPGGIAMAKAGLR